MADANLTLSTAPDFMTVAQFCDLTQSGRDHIYRLVRQGEIPSIRVGNSIRIPKRPLVAETAATGTSAAYVGHRFIATSDTQD